MERGGERRGEDENRGDWLTLPPLFAVLEKKVHFFLLQMPSIWKHKPV